MTTSDIWAERFPDATLETLTAIRESVEFRENSILVACFSCRATNRIRKDWDRFDCYKCGAEYWIERYDEATSRVVTKVIDGKKMRLVVQVA